MTGDDFARPQPVTHDPRGDITAEINAAVRQLRADLMNEIDDLRDEIRSLQRLIDSRTEHLA